MLINDIWFELRDGRKALLTSPEEKYVDSTLDFLRISAGETDFITRYPEEFDEFTREGEKELFYQMNASNNDVMILCIVDGKVAGNCSIQFKTSLKTKHRASVGIALLKEFWNLGIGTEMFKEMIRLAKDRENITQIELEFVEGNTRARALYEKMGFRIAGVLPNAIRLKDGTLLNEYVMTLEI